MASSPPTLDRAGFETLITEAPGPRPPGTTMFDSQLGFAIRRWCAPVLDLEPSAPADSYLRAPRRARRRRGEPAAAAGRAGRRVAGGHRLPDRPGRHPGADGGGERRARARDRPARGGRRAGRPRRHRARPASPRRSRRRSTAATKDAVGLKSIVAYRLRPGLRSGAARRGGRQPRRRAGCCARSTPTRRPALAGPGPAPAPDLDRDRHRPAAAVPRRVRRHRRAAAPVRPVAAARLPARHRADRHAGHAAALLSAPAAGRLPAPTCSRTSTWTSARSSTTSAHGRPRCSPRRWSSRRSTRCCTPPTRSACQSCTTWARSGSAGTSPG